MGLCESKSVPSAAAWSQPTNELTLYYLPLRARAECLRMMLHYGKVTFNNVTVPFEQWGDMKQVPAAAPFGQLPVLKLRDGTVIAQTAAIAYYVAKLAKVYPANPAAAAKADMIFELAFELSTIGPLLNFWDIKSDAWKTNHATYFEELPQRLAAAERLLGAGPFFGGAQPHHGDFALFHMLDATQLVRPGSLDKYPRLRAFVASMAALPAVSEYLRSRPGPSEVGTPGSFIQMEVATKQRK